MKKNKNSRKGDGTNSFSSTPTESTAMTKKTNTNTTTTTSNKTTSTAATIDGTIDKLIINIAGQLTVLETLLKKDSTFQGNTKHSFYNVSKSLLHFVKVYKNNDNETNNNDPVDDPIEKYHGTNENNDAFVKEEDNFFKEDEKGNDIKDWDGDDDDDDDDDGDDDIGKEGEAGEGSDHDDSLSVASVASKNYEDDDNDNEKGVTSVASNYGREKYEENKRKREEAEEESDDHDSLSVASNCTYDGDDNDKEDDDSPSVASVASNYWRKYDGNDKGKKEGDQTSSEDDDTVSTASVASNYGRKDDGDDDNFNGIGKEDTEAKQILGDGVDGILPPTVAFRHTESECKNKMNIKNFCTKMAPAIGEDDDDDVILVGREEDDKEKTEQGEVEKTKRSMRLHDIEEKILSMRKKVSYGQASAVVLPFNSLDEVIQWVKDSDLDSCGIFWDLFSLLSVKDPTTSTRFNEQAEEEDDILCFETKEEKQKRKQKYLVSLLECDLLSSMRLEQPGPQSLQRHRPYNDQNDLDYGFFEKCDSYEDWTGDFLNRPTFRPTRGVIHRLTMLLDNNCDKVRNCTICYDNDNKTSCDGTNHDGYDEYDESGLFSSSASSSSSAVTATGAVASHQLLALMLLDAAKCQFDALQSFINDMYILFTQKGRISKGRAWCVIGRCVHHIFDSMYKFRKNVKSAEYEIVSSKEEKQELVIGPVIWSILQSFTAFNKFMGVGFLSHHLIQEEILSFSLKDQYLLSTKTDSLIQWRNDTEKKYQQREEEIQTLHTIVDELKKELKDMKQRNVSVKVEKQITTSIVDDVKTKRMEEVERRINSMGLLAGENGGNAEEVLPFSSEAEVIQWVKDVNLTTFGEFWDLFSVLHNILPESLTSREILLRQCDAKARHLSMAEYYLMSAMSESNYTPYYLESENVREGYDIGGPRVDDGEIHCGFFGWCESMEQWKGAFANICRTMTTDIERYCDEGKASIRRKYEKQQRRQQRAGNASTDTTSGFEHVLAMKLLDAVKAQWSRLSRFIDESFDVLTVRIPPYKVWPLLGRCIYVIFSSMSQIRHKGILPGAALPLENEPPTKEERQEKVIGPMIWAVLSCHRRFHEIAKDGFLSHPLIKKESKDFLQWMK